MLKLNLILQIMNWDRPLRKCKNKQVFGLMKDELGGIVWKNCFELRAKKYGYLIDGGSEDKKS